MSSLVPFEFLSLQPCQYLPFFRIRSTGPSLFSSMNIPCCTCTHRCRFERTVANPDSDTDLVVRDLVHCLKRLNSPFYLHLFKLQSPKEILSLTSTILLALFSFHHPDTERDKHFVVIDCERKIVLDNSVPHPISFHNFTYKQLMKATSCRRIERVWQVKVNFKRRNETKYV